MSRQRSLERDRAKAAWDCIIQVKQCNEQLIEKDRYDRGYGGLAKSAPADIHANGLGQTLAFWRAKGYERGQPKNNNAHAELLTHTSIWLRSQKILPDGRDAVEWIAKDALTNDYRRATSEAIAFLNWLKRFAEAELPKGE
jgi:CRISPR-associated protein Cmr5